MAAIRVVVHGVLGKMGREVVAALSREADIEPVGGVDKAARGDRFELPDGQGSIPLSSNLDHVLGLTKPQVMVDFSQAEATMAAAQVAASHGVNLVIGTTGLSEGNLQQLDRIAREQSVGIFVGPNFARGAVVLMHLAKQAAPFFDYAEIVEMHHEAKIDSPSGTAMALARAIAQNKEFKHNRPEKEPLPGARGGEYKGISVHSMRMAGRSAHHEVTFGIAGQTLTLRHDTLGRDCYMPGIIKAIHEVVGLKGLVVGLDKILGL